MRCSICDQAPSDVHSREVFLLKIETTAITGTEYYPRNTKNTRTEMWFLPTHFCSLHSSLYPMSKVHQLTPQVQLYSGFFPEQWDDLMRSYQRKLNNLHPILRRSI